MRLLICEADDPDQVKSALSHVNLPGASVLINPQWLSPDPNEKLWIACGAPALKMVQSAGWIPKKGGVEANRGKLFIGIQPDGWSAPIALGVTYAPQIFHIEYADFVALQADLGLYRRYEQTGSLAPKLGHYTYADDLSGVIRFLKAKYAATGQPVELALDTETEGLDPFNPTKRVVCIQASAKAGIADVVYVLHDHTNFDGEVWTATERLERIIGQLQWIAAQPWIKVIGANFKFDMLWLRVKYGIVFKNFAFDTCNGGSLLEENRSNTLNLHTKIYSPELGGYDDPLNQKYDKSKMGAVPMDDLLPYAGGDTDACLRNYHKIRAGLLADNLTPSGKPAKNSLASVYLNVIHPTLYALHKMEYTGVYVNVDRFHAFGADLQARVAETTQKALKFIPKALLDKYGGIDTKTGGAPLSKSKMIADFLFTPLGLNLKPLQTTEKTGAPSTAEYHLTQFKDHPEARALIELYQDYQSVSKMHGTYYEGFLKHLRHDNRWHSSYIIHKAGGGKDNEGGAAGTVTGRGSATAPAFQCVTGDAEIITPDGLRTAEEIIDPIIPPNAYNPMRAHSMLVYGREGFVRTSAVFRSWRADLLRVRLICGVELRCTPEHPIWTRRGWVKARDLDTYDHVPIPKQVPRLPPKAPWDNAILVEALGVIHGGGYVSMVAPRVDIEVPADLGPWLQDALGQIAFAAGLAYVEDKAVVTLTLEEPLTQTQAEFLLALPEPGGETLPRAIRATEAFYPYLRGLVRGGGDAARRFRAGVPSLRVYTPRRDLAEALVRESLLEGLVPATIRPREDHYEVYWTGVAATHMLARAGIETPEEPWKFSVNYLTKAYEPLRVAAIEPAGAGWVYDFTVPGTHEFRANSLIVHNTVPKHSYWGKRLRECIVAPEGYVILGRDYSQGELKIAACWAGEQKMIHAYKSGIDLHLLTAATVNGMSYEEALNLKKVNEAAYDTLRQNGKAGNFGLIYGMQAYGFMMYADMVYGVKLTIEEAEEFRDTFFGDLYPGLPMWHDRQITEARTTGQVRSPLGRIRHLPNINSPIQKVRKGAQNQAINSPIQGTLVDMMWMSLGIIETERPELLVPFGQVHDQGLWYVPEDKVDEALAYSGEVMENLPLEAKFGWNPELVFTTDAEVGSNLSALTKVKKVA